MHLLTAIHVQINSYPLLIPECVKHLVFLDHRQLSERFITISYLCAAQHAPTFKKQHGKINT